VKTKLTGRYIVGFDSEKQEHVIFKNGELVFEGDTVLYVGKRYEGEVDRVIDASRCLVSPGLIDMHALMDAGIHPLLLDQEKKRGMYRPESWVRDPNETPVFTRAEVRAAAEHTFLSMLRSGVTTFCGITAMVFKRWDDPVWEPEVYVETAVRYGLRAYLSHHFRSGAQYVHADGSIGWAWDEAKGFRGLERNIAFIKKYQGSFDGKINGLLFPYTCDQVTPELLKATRQAATELGVGIRMHFAQSQLELKLIAEKHNGMTPTEYLESLGFLGSDVMLTHALYGRGFQGGPWMSDEELATIARYGVTVTNCPWIYSMRGGYLMSLSRYSEAGVNVCLGTDTQPDDILREMRWGAMMGKVAEGRADTATAREVYNAVTVNAATFLKRTDIGRLAPGSKADITIVDLDRPALSAQDDPIRCLVYFASMADVKQVIIGGKTVVENFHCPLVDEAEVSRAAQNVSGKVKETLLNWDQTGQSMTEFFPPSFEMR
jgi:5-methylthioadenosine/S-adenosylhomocysteine deaminase